jgi:dienelactone hydrolase
MNLPRPCVGLIIAVTAIVFLGMASPVLASDLTALQRRLEPHFRLRRPQGDGPFPAVMLVSGCSGFAPREAAGAYTRVAEQLVGEGFAVIFVDYLAARGLTSCRDRGGAKGFAPEIAQDVLATATYLRSQPFVKTGDVVAMGWSMGGGAVLAALGSMVPSDPLSMRAVVAFYPLCSDVKPWKGPVPALMLLGGLDDMAPATECQSLAKKVGGAAPVEVRVYPDARHGFDVSEFPSAVKWGPGTVGYNEAATRAAWEEIHKFLGR